MQAQSKLSLNLPGEGHAELCRLPSGPGEAIILKRVGAALIITYTILGFLIVFIVSWAPKPYSNYTGPYITLNPPSSPAGLIGYSLLLS